MKYAGGHVSRDEGITLVSIQFLMNKCPRCENGVDVHFLNVCSLLGPPAVECGWCGETVATERIEWQEMRPIFRRWFVVISLVYAVLAFFLGVLSIHGGMQLLTTGTFLKEWSFHQPESWISGAATSLIILLIQIRRVRSSQQRSIGTKTQLSNSLLTFDAAGQLKVLLIGMIFPCTAWGLSKFVFALDDETRVIVQVGVLGFVAVATVGGIWFYHERRQTRRRLHGEWVDHQRAETPEQMIRITRSETMPDCCVICGETGTTRVRLKFPPKDQIKSEVVEPGTIRRLYQTIPSVVWSLPFCKSHSRFALLWQRLQLPLLALALAAIAIGVWMIIATNLLWPVGVAITVSVLSVYFARPLSITPKVVSKHAIEFESSARFAAAHTETNRFRVADEPSGNTSFY